MGRVFKDKPGGSVVEYLGLVQELKEALAVYPPDKQEKATQTVLQQAELLCADWAS